MTDDYFYADDVQPCPCCNRTFSDGGVYGAAQGGGWIYYCGTYYYRSTPKEKRDGLHPDDS